MRVRREIVVTAVVALVLTVVLIGVVSAEFTSSPVTDEQSRITNLRLSDSCGGPGMILFPAGTETVYLVFDYSDMHGEEMRIAVTGPKFNVEAEHPSVIKSSGWITETWSEAHGGEYVKACGAVSPNATLTSTFRADAISMSYVKDADGGVAEVRNRGEHVEGLTAVRRYGGVREGRRMQVEGEIVRQAVAPEDVLEQRFVTRAEEDVVVGDLCVAPADAEVDDEERHAEAFALEPRSLALGVAVVAEQVVVGVDDVGVRGQPLP